MQDETSPAVNPSSQPGAAGADVRDVEPGDLSWTPDAFDIGGWTLEPATRRLHLTPRARSLLGLDPAWSGTWTQLLDVFAAADRARLEAAVADALDPDGQGAAAVELRVQHEGGRRASLACRIVRRGDPDATRVQGALLALAAPTPPETPGERPRAQAAEHANEDLYRAFVFNSSAGVYRLELDPPIDPALAPDEQVELVYRNGRFAECNDAFARMYGFEAAAELVGQGIEVMLPPDDPAAHEYLRGIIEAGYHVVDRESVERDRQGQSVYFANSITGVVEDGLLVRAWGVQRDITERRRREVNAALLGDLQDELARLTTAGEIMHAVGACLGGFLQIASSFFADVDQQQDQVRIHHVWKTVAVPPMPLAFRVSDVLTDDINRSFPFDQPIIVNDTEDDPRLDPTLYRVMQMRAVLGVPFHRNGVWRSALIVSDTRARVWRSDEVELFQEVANRVFPRLERAHVEEALRESQARLQLALDAGEMGTFVWYPADDRSEPDARMLALFGLPADGSMSLAATLDRLIHPADRARHAAAVELALDPAGSGQLREDVRVIYPDGSERWLAITARGAFDDGTPRRALSMTGIAADITDRKRAEAALRESEERLRVLVESVQDYAIYTLDPSGHVTSWNEGARRLKGYTVEEIVGQSIDRFFSPEDIAAGKPAREMDTALRAGRAEDESWRVRKDGTRFWGNEIMTPLYADDGTHLGFTKITRDTTARKEADEAMARSLAVEQQARAQLEETARLKDEFLATVSHELRTPITAMLGYSQLLQLRRANDPYVARTAERMVQSAKTQAQLVEDLLDVSRSVSGTLSVTLRHVDLVPVVQAAIDTVRPAMDSKGVQLRMALSHAGTTVLGDAQRLQQIAWNVLSNAVKFTPAGGRIGVELQAVDEHVQLIVRDTGQGIRPSFLPYVFERFRQQEGSSTRSAGGMGLGLAIVRQLVELHGGSVEVWSEGEGLGTEVRVVLPRVEGPSQLEAAPDRQLGGVAAATDAQPDGLRVLLVDDQADVLALLEETLSAAGAEVRAHTSAPAALAELQAWRPDVLVSDIAMPEHDGYWLIARVRELPQAEGGATPALALTAYVRIEDRLRVLNAGFQLFVPKPVEAQELLASVARLMRMSASDTD